MVLKLDKVNRGPHLPTLVASSLSREIVEGRLEPGAQLPTEQVLAQTFGVSRNVIREAIARLRSEGRVWSQQGRGAFVSQAPNATVLTIDHQGLQSADAFGSLFEFRGILEVQAAALAAERRSAQDIEALHRAHAAMVAAPYGSTAWLDADLDMHRAIAMATGNGYMVQVLGFVSDRVRESILMSGNKDRSDDLAQVTLGEHERILEAIEAQDSAEAQRAMRLHLEGAERRVGVTAMSGASRAAAATPRPDALAAKRKRVSSPRATRAAAVP